MVDDEGCGRALPHRLVHLVLAGSVVPARFLEERGVLVGRRASEREHDPPADVGAGIIVPAELRSHDSVADEHRLARHGRCGVRSQAVRHEVDHRLDRIAAHQQLRCRLAADQRNPLIVRAVVPGRLEAEARELGGEVFRRDLAAALAGAAALERVIGEDREVCLDHPGVNRARDGGAGRRLCSGGERHGG